jgi:1-acyl-sn-glycerol-3-phosphate acyltransferase
MAATSTSKLFPDPTLLPAANAPIFALARELAFPFAVFCTDFCACTHAGRAKFATFMSTHIHPIASLLAAVARGISGVQVQWAGCEPDERQRIYFANHTSHLDFVVLWSALPSEIRARVRPIAAKDYWDGTPLRRYLAQNVFHAVLLERGSTATKAKNAEDAHFVGRHLIDEMVEALGSENSLILFPEGTRGTGEKMAPFRSGMYHLAIRRPDVELVPAYLDNLNRILPKGEVLPVPMLSLLTFGKPLQVEPGEDKDAFLERAREAVAGLRRIGSN